MLFDGQIIDEKYEITRFIGRGFHTLLYEARDLFIGRRLLAKQISPQLSPMPQADQLKGDFKKQTALLSNLIHPGIPRVMDFIESPRGFIRVTEFIEGKALSEIIREQGKIDVNSTVELSRQLLDILMYLHRLDPPVIHGDLRPSHLIVHGNKLYLTNLEHAFREEEKKDFAGFPGYGAPERYWGETESGQASDIYSAGVVIHQMLTGESPLKLPPGEPPSMEGAKKTGAPGELIWLLENALCPDPENRIFPAARFCSGLSLVKSIMEESIPCPQCQKANPSGALFCCFCGSPLIGGDTEKSFDRLETKIPHSSFWKGSSYLNGVLYPLSLMAARPLGFENLITIDHNRIDEYPHQIKAVKRALKDMGGRCLLADEVGLGKTIEAGIIMEELRARGLIKSVLIITPSHLKHQWRDEMREKFDEKFKVYASQKSIKFEKDRHVIISLAAASRNGKTRDGILERKWDLLIVDEAHHARNRRTLRWSLLDSIKKDFILLLTATPVQNNLSDLFNLVSLLRPGHLKNIGDFQKKFVDPDNPRRPKNPEELRRMLSEVMIRTRRSDALIRFPRRLAFTRMVQLDPRERELYDEVTGFIRELSAKDKRSTPFGMVQLIQRLTSSPAAASFTLEKLSRNGNLYSPEEQTRWKEYSLLAEDIHEPAKLLETLDIIRAARDRIVIFTDHIPTQDYLKDYLERSGYDTLVYRGSGVARSEILERFRKEGRILVVPQSGGEGLNLQDTTNILINYDLPWNPMRLEQRIGRLQRLGQDRDVYVFNLAGKDTVESYILEVLQDKIKMFNLAIGQLDLILGTRFDEERSFENLIWDKILSAGDKNTIRDKILSIGEELDQEIKDAEVAVESETYLSELAV